MHTWHILYYKVHWSRELKTPMLASTPAYLIIASRHRDMPFCFHLIFVPVLLNLRFSWMLVLITKPPTMLCDIMWWAHNFTQYMFHIAHMQQFTPPSPLWRGQPRRLPALKKFRHALLWFGITNCSRLPEALPSANGLWYTQCLWQSWVVLNNKLKRHTLCRKRLSSISICGERSKTNHCTLIT